MFLWIYIIIQTIPDDNTKKITVIDQVIKKLYEKQLLIVIKKPPCLFVKKKYKKEMSFCSILNGSTVQI